MSDNIRTDAIELLCTKDDFVELMDDNARLCDQIKRLEADIKFYERHVDCRPPREDKDDEPL